MNTRNEEWWPIALASEVGTEKPQGFFLDGEPIVLFRDEVGEVRALENRCPHRRVPLSLGRIRPEGWLQCGYHGWSFDGATGQCKAIPNLRANERVPPIYAAFAYDTAERDGLIYVAGRSAVQELPAALHPSAGRIFSGRTMVGLGHDEYIAALMDGPHLLLNCAGIHIAQTMVADPQLMNDRLVMERAAFWTGQTRFDGFVREYKLLFRLEVHRVTGDSWISFRRPDGMLVSAAHWAVTPSARGVTAILWQSFAADAQGVRPALLRAAAKIGRAPIAPRKQIDMAAVAELLAGPSEHWTRSTGGLGIYGDALVRERART